MPTILFSAPYMLSSLDRFRPAPDFIHLSRTLMSLKNTKTLVRVSNLFMLPFLPPLDDKL
jgi:hypothetical protein